MRFLSRNMPRHSETDDDEISSIPSSVQSVASYEVFGSACSDSSDCEYCEYCEYRRRRRRDRNISNYYSPMSASNASTSYVHTARDMLRADPPTERTTLLGVPATAQGYNTSASADSLGPADLTSKAVLSTYMKFDKPKTPDRKKQSSLVTIFSVWNTTMGSSLLTMAWGVERAGLAPALLLLVLMGGLCLYTALLLLKVSSRHGVGCEVPALCRSLLGGWAEGLAHVFSLLVLVGANVVYWILITNFLFYTVNYFIDVNAANGTEYNSTLSCVTPLVPEAPVTPQSPYWDQHSTVPIYVAVLVFPLMNFRNPSFFTKFNSLGTLSVVYLLVFVVVKGALWGVNVSPVLVSVHAHGDAAALSGMLALSFYIHNIIISIMASNQHQENNGRDLTIAFILVTLTYSLVGAIFYICFPLIKSCIEDNMLNNFEMHDVMTVVARMLLLFQVVTVFPLVAFMLRSEVLLLLPCRPQLKQRAAPTVLLNTGIVLLCVLAACFCPNIGTIIRYTGAVSGLVHVFALPALLQLRSLQLRGKLRLRSAALYTIIIVFGLLNLAMQFFI